MKFFKTLKIQLVQQNTNYGNFFVINSIQTFYNIKYFQNDEVHNLRIQHIKKVSENLSVQKFNKLNFL